MRRLRFPAAILVSLALLGGASSPGWAYLDAKAAYRMALRHHHPLGSKPRNYRVAMMLYCRADADDYADAAFAIGLLYTSGHGVQRSERKAAAWFKRAAELGSGEAKLMLQDLRMRKVSRSPRCPNGWGRTGSRPVQVYAPDEIRTMVRKMAPRFSLDPRLVLAVISVESSFQPDAVSSANARGLMQLIPATAERFGVRNVFDAEENIRGGMAYLRWLLDRFKGDVTLALAGYNAGEGAVDRYGGVPPYKETRNYVKKIRRLYPAARHPL